MKIRRYVANNAQEAILKVKMDLGNEAVILNTRKVRKKGIMNFFAKPMVEVLAAIDEYANVKNDKSLQAKKDKVLQPIQESKTEKISELESKVSSMEIMLNKIYEHVQINNEKNQAYTVESPESSKILDMIHSNLIKNDVDQEIASKIMELVKSKYGSEIGINDAASIIRKIIAGMLGKPETINLRSDGKPTVVMFVGPTGVGKTTTLAKIAANFALNMKKNVGLITADTYRIAAVEQLKTYAEILGMPVSVAYTSSEIKDAIGNYQDKDVILVDTAGRSHRNKNQFDELKSLINACGADEIYLVLSATTSMRNCKEIMKNYSFLVNYKLIFTKLDETPITGIILNARCLTNKTLSYVTTGQSVPDDFEVANIESITKNLLGSIT